MAAICVFPAVQFAARVRWSGPGASEHAHRRAGDRRICDLRKGQGIPMVTSSTSAPAVDADSAGDVPERQPATVILYWRFAGGYFHERRPWLRRLAVAGLLVLSGVQTFIQVRINLWNVDFFNALERKEVDE